MKALFDEQNQAFSSFATPFSADRVEGNESLTGQGGTITPVFANCSVCRPRNKRPTQAQFQFFCFNKDNGLVSGGPVSLKIDT
jgi:hypothetical protein